MIVRFKNRMNQLVFLSMAQKCFDSGWEERKAVGASNCFRIFFGQKNDFICFRSRWSVLRSGDLIEFLGKQNLIKKELIKRGIFSKIFN